VCVCLAESVACNSSSFVEFLTNNYVSARSATIPPSLAISMGQIWPLLMQTVGVLLATPLFAQSAQNLLANYGTMWQPL